MGPAGRGKRGAAVLEVSGVGAGRGGEAQREGGGQHGGAPEETFACAVVVRVGVGGVGEVGAEDLGGVGGGGVSDG